VDLIIDGSSVWGLVKMGYIVVFVIYLIFAIVVFRQVGLMGKTLKIGFDKFIKVIALGHLAMVATLFLWALVVL